MRGDDVQQLAGEDGVDRLAVAVGEAFQGQDLGAKRRVGPSFTYACGLLRPPKRDDEARDRGGQVLRVGGNDIQQLAGEDGVDRLAVAVGEAFQ